MLRRFAFSTLLAAAALTLTACEDSVTTNALETISGTVAYRERIALPPTAKVKVSLVDVSLADAPSTTIAETEFTPSGNVPIAYSISYDPAKITEGHSYALQARVTDQEKLLFITDTQNQVLGDGPNATDLMMVKVR